MHIKRVLGTEPKFSSVMVVTIIAGDGGKLVKEVDHEG